MARKIISTKKGMTLIELILYMSIFAIMITGFLSVSFYIQKIIQTYTYIYEIKTCVYKQLTILEQYANLSEDLRPQLTLNEQKHLVLVYTKPHQLRLRQCGESVFQSVITAYVVKPKTITQKSTVYISIEYLDVRGKHQIIEQEIMLPKVAPIDVF